MVAGILTSDGYEVLVAHRVKEALGLVKRHGRPIDLLVADLTDSRGHGLELARELQALKPGFRILCPANVETPRLVPWLAVERQAHLVRPFTLSELLRKTRALLDARPSA
jgi:DNA-binding response OmpR family regulator